MNETSVQNHMISIDEHTHIFPTEYFLKKPHKIDNTLSKLEPITKIIENAVIDIKYNGQFTNHDIKKNIRRYDKIPIGPDINTITNFLSKFSSLTYEKTDNMAYEKNAVFIYSISSIHYAIQHIWMDYAKQLLYFYDLLKTSPETCIIFEIVPTIPECSYFPDNVEQNSSININKITTFLSDIGLSNKIYTISHFSKLNSIVHLYIYKLQYLGYICPTDYTRYISLANLLIDMDIPKITKKILEDNKNHFYNKLHLDTNKQKYLILEKRVWSRTIPESEYIRIYELCNNYCKENNLCLFIWDDSCIRKYTIYHQLVISSNAEVIIGYGGSMWMYNFTMNKGHILVINTFSELLGNEILDNILMNVCYIYGCNRNYYPEIKKYIHLHDKKGGDGIFPDVYTIVECFLLRLIKN